MEEKKEWRFKCPHCKSDSRLVQEVVDDDRGRGRIDDSIREGAMSIEERPIKSNTKQYAVGDEVSVLLIFTDLCSVCGTMYIFKVLRDIRKMRKDITNLVKPHNLTLPRSN